MVAGIMNFWTVIMQFTKNNLYIYVRVCVRARARTLNSIVV